jgi:RNA polymerase I-specific transcription initiation factor RRN3
MELFPAMASNFPFRTRPALHLIFYCRHCFAALDYLPGIHGQVLELIIERSLEIDVEIKINDGGEVSFDQENDEGVFELELDANEKPSPTKINPEEVTVDEMADKVSVFRLTQLLANPVVLKYILRSCNQLDSLMLLLFEHIQSRVKSSANTLQQFYDMISPAFDSSILITHKSKFVQFIIFLLCGLDSAPEADQCPNVQAVLVGADLYREFAAKLIEVILDPYRATVTRQSGVCYLASFVSRATYICPETMCETVSALLRWAEAYIASWSPQSARGSNSRHQCESHSLFYTICQAAFYIMCFQGDQAVRYYQVAWENQMSGNSSVDDEDAQFALSQTENIDIGRDRWTRLCGHELQPLRFCLESVRCEFLHVARVFDLLDPQLLDKLAAEALSSSNFYTDRRRGPSRISTAATLEKQRVDGGIGGLGRGSNPLDSFFPFDPYLLRRSHCFIEPFYKEWNGPIEEGEHAEGIDHDDVAQHTGTLAKDLNGDKDVAHVNDDDNDDATAIVTSNESEVPGGPMSLASSSTTYTNARSVSTSPNALSKKETQELAWKASLKRSRAYSGENGSW